MSKKYYSISEVGKILGVGEGKIRRLDGIFNGKLTIVRGRRYYKIQDIEALRKLLSPAPIKTNSENYHDIDRLLNSMKILKSQLLSAIGVHL